MADFIGIRKVQRDERSRYFSLANQQFVESTKSDHNYADSWLRWSQSLYREKKYIEAWGKLKKARSLGAKEPDKYLKALEQKLPDPDKKG